MPLETPYDPLNFFLVPFNPIRGPLIHLIFMNHTFLETCGAKEYTLGLYSLQFIGLLSESLHIILNTLI